MIDSKTKWTTIKTDAWLKECFHAKTGKHNNSWLYQRITAQMIKRLADKIGNSANGKPNVNATNQSDNWANSNTKSDTIICIAKENSRSTDSRKISYAIKKPIIQSIRKLINQFYK